MAVIGKGTISGITTASNPGDVVTKEVVDSYVGPSDPSHVSYGQGTRVNAMYHPTPRTHASVWSVRSINGAETTAWSQSRDLKKEYTSAGSYTFNVRTNTSKIIIDAWGGGGGGGSATTDTSSFVIGSVWNQEYDQMFGGASQSWPYACAVGPNARMVAGTGGKLSSTFDLSAKTGWTIRTGPWGSAERRGATYSTRDSLYWVTGASNYLCYSTDSVIWTLASSAAGSANMGNINIWNGIYFHGGGNIYGPVLEVSTDGVTWEVRTEGLLTRGEVMDTDYAYSSYYCVSNMYGSLSISTDTISWASGSAIGNSINNSGRVNNNTSAMRLVANNNDNLLSCIHYAGPPWYNTYYDNRPSGTLLTFQTGTFDNVSYTSVPYTFAQIDQGTANYGGPYYTYITNGGYDETNGQYVFMTINTYSASYASIIVSTDLSSWEEVNYPVAENTVQDYGHGFTLNPIDGYMFAGWKPYGGRGFLLYAPGANGIAGFSGQGGSGGAYTKFSLQASQIDTTQPINIDVAEGGAADTVGGATTISWTDINGTSCSVEVAGGNPGSYGVAESGRPEGASLSSYFDEFLVSVSGGGGSLSELSPGPGKAPSSYTSTDFAMNRALGGGGGAVLDSSTTYNDGGEPELHWQIQNIIYYDERDDYQRGGSWGGKGGSVWNQYLDKTVRRFRFDFAGFGQQILVNDQQSTFTSPVCYDSNKILNGKYIFTATAGVLFSTDGFDWRYSFISDTRHSARRPGSTGTDLPGRDLSMDYFSANGYYYASMSTGTNNETYLDVNNIYKSTDLINWSSEVLPDWTGSRYGTKSIAASSNRLVVLTSRDTNVTPNITKYSYVTTDGLVWEKHSIPDAVFNGDATSFHYADNTFLAVHTSNYARSTDGIVWEGGNFPITDNKRIVYGNGYWVVGGVNYDSLCASTDTYTWQVRTLPSGASTLSGTYDSAAGLWIYSGEGVSPDSSYPMRVSTDTIVWEFKPGLSQQGAGSYGNRDYNNWQRGPHVVVDSDGTTHYMFLVHHGLIGDRYYESHANIDGETSVMSYRPYKNIGDGEAGEKGSGGGGGAIDADTGFTAAGGKGGDGYVSIEYY